MTGFTTATLTNNIILRSSDQASGDGIEIGGHSKARSVNNTICNNAAHGILVESTASASVDNTILSANAKGDILGQAAGSVRFSLIGDGSSSGSGNVSGDPKFMGSAAGDFSLSPGSPALGTGDSSAPGLPFVDFGRRSRVTIGFPTTAAIPGHVDMGAVETNSTYPLPFPVMANGLQTALGGSVVTGLAILNSSGSSGTATFGGYVGTGTQLPIGGSAVKSVGPASQVPILAYQLFGLDFDSSFLGSILASSTQPLTGYLFLFDPDFTRFTTGASVAGQTLNDLIFMRHLNDGTGKTSYILFNPGNNPAAISSQLFAPSGSVVGSAQASVLPPKQQSVLRFEDVTSSAGFVRVTSDRPLAGMEVFGDSQALTALTPSSPGSEARLFFPHIAENAGFSTRIGIVNTNATPVDLTITAYTDHGTVLGTPAAIVLEANSQLLGDASSLFGLSTSALQTGYAIAQGDQAGVIGFTLFGYADGPRRASATVPADSVPFRRMVFPHIANQVPAGAGRTYLTGLALLNPFGAPVEFTLTVFDKDGKIVAQKTEILGGRQKTARFLSQSAPGAGFFTQPIALGSGHIEVTSDYGLLGLELFFTDDFSQLAAVPAVPPALVR